METVDTDEIEEARDERVRSETIDSGLEPEDAALIEGLRELNSNLSMLGSVPG